MSRSHQRQNLGEGTDQRQHRDCIDENALLHRYKKSPWARSLNTAGKKYFKSRNLRMSLHSSGTIFAKL